MNFSPAFDLQKEYAKYKNVIKGAKEGEFVTRFPPEPSGYLHIGHVKASMINYHYARIYKGKMIFRFDDTNPTKEKQEYSQSIFEDLATLGVCYDKFSHSSDHFLVLLDYCEKLISKGLAFCDNTDRETMQKERGEKKDSRNRDLPVEENLRIFSELKKLRDQIPEQALKELREKAKAEGKEFIYYADYCIRAKIDMKSNNGTMRDPVIYRVNFTPHPREDLKYEFKLYPTYDFTCPIVDSIEGVTHAMRTNEYSDRIEQYNWFIKHLELRPVTIWEFSRLNMVNTCMSKRKLQWFVDNKIVEDWTDPRFPTVRGIMRRGLRVETLTQFMLENGPSKNSNLMEWDKLWAINKQIIDPISKRFSAVSSVQTANFFVENGPELETFEIEHHPNLPNLGKKSVYRSKNLIIDHTDALDLKEGERVTILKWGNFLVKQKKVDGDNISFVAEFLPEDADYKTTRLKLTWLCKDSPLTLVTIVEYDHLIKVPKIEDNMVFEDIVNHDSKFTTQWWADPAVKTLKENDFFQFERKGYFRIDKVRETAAAGESTHELIFIPDGKTKSMSGTVMKVNPELLSRGTKKQEEKQEEKKEEKTGENKEEKKSKSQLKKEEAAAQKKENKGEKVDKAAQVASNPLVSTSAPPAPPAPPAPSTGEQKQ